MENNGKFVNITMKIPYKNKVLTHAQPFRKPNKID